MPSTLPGWLKVVQERERLSVTNPVEGHVQSTADSCRLSLLTLSTRVHGPLAFTVHMLTVLTCSVAVALNCVYMCVCPCPCPQGLSMYMSGKAMREKTFKGQGCSGLSPCGQ